MNSCYPDMASQMLEKMKKYPYLFQWLQVRGQKLYYDAKPLHPNPIKAIKAVLENNPDPEKFYGSLGGCFLFTTFFYPNDYKISFRNLKKKEMEKFQDLKHLKKIGGWYVAFISHSTRAVAHHAITINCDEELIYDTEGKSVMKLNQEALDMCIGGNEKFVHFHAIYELYSYP